MDANRALAVLEQFRHELNAWSRSQNDAKLRSAITQKLAAVRQIVGDLELTKIVTMVPPAMVGGPVMQFDPLQDPFGESFRKPYYPMVLDIVDEAIGALRHGVRPKKLKDPKAPKAETRVAAKKPPEKDHYEAFATTKAEVEKGVAAQVTDAAVRSIILRDMQDALENILQGKSKVTTILCGGILEAVLDARLANESATDLEAAFRAYAPTWPANKPVPALSDMKLHQLVGVAAKRKKLRNHKLYDNIRDWRNLVHPAAEIREGSVSKNDAEIAFRAVIELLIGRS